MTSVSVPTGLCKTGKYLQFLCFKALVSGGIVLLNGLIPSLFFSIFCLFYIIQLTDKCLQMLGFEQWISGDHSAICATTTAHQALLRGQRALNN